MSKKTYILTLAFVVIVLLGKVLGFLRDILISSFYGADYRTDAYFVANTIPSLIFVGFFSTVSLVFLPHYNKIRIEKGKIDSSKFASNVLNTYALISVVISFLGVLFAEELVGIVAPSFNAVTFSLCVKLTRILCLSFLFSISTGILSAIQNVNKAYLGPQLIPLVNNVVIIVAIVLLTSQYGIEVLAYSSFFAWVLQVPLQYFLSRKMFSYRPRLKLNDKAMMKMGAMILPAFIGISIDQLNFLIDSSLGSSLEEGSISALNYSIRLINFFSGLFVIVIANIIYPKISDTIVGNDNEGINKLLNSTLKVFMLIALPATIISCIMRTQIVSLVYARGQFDAVATAITSEVFLYYSIGILFILIREVNNKLFYAKLDTKTPLYISLAAILVNVVLSVTLVKSMGVSGLAFATTISIIFYVVIQFLVLLRSIGSKFLSGVIPFILKLLIAGLGMGASIYLLVKFSTGFFSQFWLLLLVSLFGLSVFLLIAKIFKVKELDNGFQKFKELLNSLSKSL